MWPLRFNQYQNLQTAASVLYYIFFFQALNFLVESFGLLNDLFPLLLILDAGYPVFNLHLADVLFDVILPSVLGSSL
jgi:ABC-type Na+ efflux pump permease subunit